MDEDEAVSLRALCVCVVDIWDGGGEGVDVYIVCVTNGVSRM